MHHKRMLPIVAAVVLTLALAAPAMADVTIKQKTKINMMGDLMRMLQIVSAVMLTLVLGSSAMAGVTIKQITKTNMMGGLMKSTGTMTIKVSGDKHANKMTMSSDMPMFGGTEMVTTNILRLDKKITWRLNPAEKVYTENTLVQLQQQKKAMGEMAGGPEQPMEFGEPEFKIERTGEKKKIADHNCELVILTMTMAAKDRKSGKSGNLVVIDRIWTTTDWAGQKEYDAFAKQAVAAVGPEWGPDAGAALFGQMGFDSDRFLAEFAAVGGFPLKQEMMVRATGDLKMVAEADMAQSRETMEQMGMAFKEIGSLFGEELEGKPEKSAKTEGKAEPKSTESSYFTMFEMLVEVESLSTDAVDDGEFEIPKDYKKF